MSQGNYGAAAQYEQQRNAKITATGSGHQQTNNYSQYLNGGNNSLFDILTGVPGQWH